MENDIHSTTSSVQKNNNLAAQLSFVTKIKQSVFVTKRKVLESLGQPPEIDAEVQFYIDKLQNTANDYTTMHKLVMNLYQNYKDFTETQRSLGNHLYEIGIKEEEGIRDTLQAIGTVHRNLEKDSIQLLRNLGSLMETIKTFRGAAVEDSLQNLERYTDTRHEYEGLLLLISDLESQTPPPSEEINNAKTLADQYKENVEQYCKDLQTKITILEEKRVQLVKSQVSSYIETLCQYYISCNEQLNELELSTSGDNTAEFDQLLSSLDPK